MRSAASTDLIPHARRRFLAALTLCLAALSAGVACAARASDVQNEGEAQEARAWLMRIHEAVGRRNFQGTFVVTAGGSVASARILHFCDGRNQYERIDSLDGQARQVLRHNDLVHTLWPASKTAVIERRQAMNEFPALLQSGDDRIVDYYDVRAQGTDRVAGHEADVLSLHPRDAYRFGYRLWAERRSGLLLRAEVLDENGNVLEASAFSDVVIGIKSQPELVLSAMKRLDGYRVQRQLLEPTELEREGWAMRQAPPGFRLVSTVRRPLDDSSTPHPASQSAPPSTQPVLQSIYSDGLTYVSVFIEPFNSAVHRREFLMALGATRTMTRRSGDWWITVIGDVPSATLRAFVSGLERQTLNSKR